MDDRSHEHRKDEEPPVPEGVEIGKPEPMAEPGSGGQPSPPPPPPVPSPPQPPGPGEG